MRMRATIIHQDSFVTGHSNLLQHPAAHVRETQVSISGSSKISINNAALSHMHAPVPDSCALCLCPARRLL